MRTDLLISHNNPYYEHVKIPFVNFLLIFALKQNGSKEVTAVFPHNEKNRTKT